MVKTAMRETAFADLWDEPEVWTSPDETADLVAFLATGADSIRSDDLYALRLRRAAGPVTQD